jgi:hypothetical protein
LTQITVTFSEPVTGVGFSDLLLNGVAAVSFSGSGATYTFFVEQPPGGSVQVTWAPETQIADLAGNPFNRTAPGATWQYNLVDSVPPTMVAQSPLPGVTVVALPQVEITFSEPVTGVGAADLLINGSPATNVAGSQAGPYVFTFPPPASGLVQLTWANGHGIADLASPPNAFAGGSWSVTLDPQFTANTIRINEFLASNTTRYSPGPSATAGKTHWSGSLSTSLNDQPSRLMVSSPKLYNSIQSLASSSSSSKPVVFDARNSLMRMVFAVNCGSTVTLQLPPAKALGGLARSAMP